MVFRDLLLVAGTGEEDSWEINPDEKFSVFRAVLLLLAVVVLPVSIGIDILNGQFRAAVAEASTIVALAITIRVHYKYEVISNRLKGHRKS